MGIRFRCHHCETELHVKDFQAGKRGRCPECKQKFRIPLSDAEHSLEADNSAAGEAADPAVTNSTIISQATSSTPETQRAPTKAVAQTSPTNTEAVNSSHSGKLTSDKAQSPSTQSPSTQSHSTQSHSAQSHSAKSATGNTPPEDSLVQPYVPVKPRALIDAPHAKWLVRPTSGNQYGPAPSESMWHWLGENRIGHDSLVWREGWPEWLVAGEVFADYFASGIVDERLGSTAATGIVDNAAQDTGESEVKNPSIAESPQPTSLSDRNRATRKQRRRRNYTIMIAILTVVMITLIVALAVVLSNQSG